MHRKLVLILLVLFLLEGTIVPWLIPAMWQTSVQVTPHFVLVGILFIAIFSHRHAGLIYGLCFGMLHDIIYYGEMIGVQSFSMGLTGYLIGLAFKNARNSMVSTMYGIVTGCLIYELTMYGLYRLFRAVQVPFNWAFMEFILPSLLINMLFALLIYVPARNFLDKYHNKRTEEQE